MSVQIIQSLSESKMCESWCIRTIILINFTNNTIIKTIVYKSEAPVIFLTYTVAPVSTINIFSHKIPRYLVMLVMTINQCTDPFLCPCLTPLPKKQ